VGNNAQLAALILAEETARKNADSTLQIELNTTQTGAGLGADGSYTPDPSANFIYNAVSLDWATKILDAQLFISNDSVFSIATLERGKIYVGDSLNVAMEVAFSGDATMATDGVLTITNEAVSNAKLADSIDATKLADGSVSNTELQYVDGVTGNIQDQLNESKPMISDADNDTKVLVEASTDEDFIRFDVRGSEAMIIDTSCGYWNDYSCLHIGCSRYLAFTKRYINQ